MKTRNLLMSLVLAASLFTFTNAFAKASAKKPEWPEIKTAVQNSAVIEKSKIIKIEDAKNETLWKDSDFPPTTLLTHSGWIYYKGELPGLVRRQLVTITYKRIDEFWQIYTGLADGTNEEVTPPAKIPPLPPAPDVSIAKDTFIKNIKEKFATGYSPGSEFLELKVDKFEYDGAPKYEKTPAGYGTVRYTSVVKIKYSGVTQDLDSYKKKYNESGEGTAVITFETTKDPATLWYDSTDVKEWNINLDINYAYFDKKSEQIKEKKANKVEEKKPDEPKEDKDSDGDVLGGLKKLF